MTSALSSLIAAQPLLQGLAPSALELLAAQPVLELPAGTRVFDTGSDCGGFPIILSGGVRVFKHLANGRRIELYRVTPDEPCILSLGCLLGGGRYPASGIAGDATRLIVMPSGLFNECVANNAVFRNAMFRALGNRLVNTMELVEEVVTLRLDVRLASALLEHAALGHAADDGGSGTIGLTHQQLADELGTVREMISRLLDDFAQRGMLALGRGRIDILDAAGLHALAATR
ncbi:Crp/Fnr family transcriptional regulator [Noviherbaspirillum sp. UKPF54]|uniref:Crp/Fnr family transcriptional regulator n=1 Tax=Noviherbaspirillum sp. UKPF54 TaxID=2601898 RepID=UPI0011B17542|nr:Crp/Fnr family transcriptional regulator [Noviherbaspirillum sp. UKPF54]QDZ27447.1 Crp/Fnr family transcriptional regulator [Noviherbaspirillum sp. UKPF54]